MVAPPLIFFLVAVIFGEVYAALAQLCGWWARVALSDLPPDGIPAGMYGGAVYY